MYQTYLKIREREIEELGFRVFFFFENKDRNWIKNEATLPELHDQESQGHLPTTLETLNANLRPCEPKHGLHYYRPY